MSFIFYYSASLFTLWLDKIYPTPHSTLYIAKVAIYMGDVMVYLST